MQTPKGKVAKAIAASESAIVTAAETAGDALGRVMKVAEAAIDSPLGRQGRKSATKLRKRVTALVAKARKKTTAERRRRPKR